MLGVRFKLASRKTLEAMGPSVAAITGGWFIGTGLVRWDLCNYLASVEDTSLPLPLFRDSAVPPTLRLALPVASRLDSPEVAMEWSVLDEHGQAMPTRCFVAADKAKVYVHCGGDLSAWVYPLGTRIPQRLTFKPPGVLCEMDDSLLGAPFLYEDDRMLGGGPTVGIRVENNCFYVDKSNKTIVYSLPTFNIQGVEKKGLGDPRNI